MLRDPDVYTKHPEPDVAAVRDAFHPQLQDILCNYAAAARESVRLLGKFLKIAIARVHYGSPKTRASTKMSTSSRSVRARSLSDARNSGWNTTWTVSSDLRHSRALSRSRNALKNCWIGPMPCISVVKRTVSGKCSLPPPKPSWSYPGLRRTTRSSQFAHLSFGRSGSTWSCAIVGTKRKWPSIVWTIPCQLSWPDVVQIAADDTKWGFPTEKGVAYICGIWKPKKQRFRFIAGTRAVSREEGGDPWRSADPPDNPIKR